MDVSVRNPDLVFFFAQFPETVLHMKRPPLKRSVCIIVKLFCYFFFSLVQAAPLTYKWIYSKRSFLRLLFETLDAFSFINNAVHDISFINNAVVRPISMPYLTAKLMDLKNFTTIYNSSFIKNCIGNSHLHSPVPSIF